MASAAELEGLKQFAKSMNTKDLKWQIVNARKLGMNDPVMLRVFQNELKARTTTV